MGRVEINQDNQRQGTASWRAGILALALWLGVLTPGASEAGGFRSPQECQPSTGEAHLNCLYEYIGIQDHNTGDVEAPIKAEQDMMEQLREQRDRIDRKAFTDHGPQSSVIDRTDIPPPAVAPTPPSMAVAPSFHSPEECRAYTGAAHLNCLYAYIELQQSKTGKIEEELRAQKGMIGQLRDQVDRQASARDDLQQRLAERDSFSSSAVHTYVPPLYPPYVYPGYGYLGYSLPGVSLYLGVPRSYFDRPFHGPRFFGPRFYGPRGYGPRSFGHYRR